MYDILKPGKRYSALKYRKIKEDHSERGIKMKKIFAVLMAIVLLFSATACSSSSKTSADKTGDTTKSDSKTSSDTSSKSDSSGDTVEIRFTNWDGGATLEAYEEAINNFMKEHPNIKVTNLNIPSEYDTKITAMIAANDTPEIAILESDSLLYPLAEEGKLVNILELIENDPEYDGSDLIDNLKYMRDPDFMAGYGIGPQNICLFYNPALFEKYGVEEPPAKYEDAWDWDTFVENAKKLTIDKNGRNALDPDFDPENIETYGLTIGKWWAMYMPFVLSAGGDYLNEDGTAIGMNSPEAIDAMQKIADLIWVHHVSPTPTASETMPGLSEGIATNKIAMCVNGQWSNNTLMDDGVEYNVAALPKIGDKAKTLITAGCLSIPDTPKKEAAWEFYKYMLSPGTLSPLEKSGAWLPSVKSGYTEEYLKSIITDKHPANYYETVCLPMLDGTAEPPTTSWVVNFNKMNNILSPALDPVWAGESSYADAVNSVLDQLNAEVNGRRDK